MFRHPRTQNERRQNQEEVIEGFRIRIRGTRKNLPSAWDDIFTPENNCWKAHRKTQYCTKPEPHKNSTKYGLSMSRRDHLWIEHRRCHNCKFCQNNTYWKRDQRLKRRSHKRFLEKEYKNWRDWNYDLHKS